MARSSRLVILDASSSGLLANPSSNPCPQGCSMTRFDNASTERPASRANLASFRSCRRSLTRTSRFIPPGCSSSAIRFLNVSQSASAVARRRVYAGTFSKVMFPGLRLGYLVVPSGLVATFVRASLEVYSGHLMLEQEAVAAFITEGHFGRHVKRMRHLYAAILMIETFPRRAADAP